MHADQPHPEIFHVECWALRLLCKDVRINVALSISAPEVLAVYPYGHTADWWSLGILMYAMLVGKVSSES